MRAPRLVAAALLLVACGPAAAPGPRPDGDPSQAVTLLEPGAEPRSPLRLRAAGPGEVSARLELAMSGDQSQGGFRAMLAPPSVLLDLRGRAQAGRLDFATEPLRLAEGEAVDPSVRGAMEVALDGTSGFQGRLELPAGGGGPRLSAAHPELENVQVQQLAASFAQALSLLAPRLPAEPIGVGARWSWTTTHRHTTGALVRQATTATLLGRGPEGASLRLESVLDAERQQLSGPPLPEGLSLDVTSLTGRGDAELVLRPEDPFRPERARASGTWELILVADRQGTAEEVRLRQEMTLTLTTEP